LAPVGVSASEDGVVAVLSRDFIWSPTTLYCVISGPARDPILAVPPVNLVISTTSGLVRADVYRAWCVLTFEVTPDPIGVIAPVYLIVACLAVQIVLAFSARYKIVTLPTMNCILAIVTTEFVIAPATY
jgi:hypothetical protein